MKNDELEARARGLAAKRCTGNFSSVDLNCKECEAYTEGYIAGYRAAQEWRPILELPENARVLFVNKAGYVWIDNTMARPSWSATATHWMPLPPAPEKKA